MPVTDRVELWALFVSVILMAGVIELVRRGKLLEEHLFAWIAAGFLLLVLSLRRNLLDVAAKWLACTTHPRCCCWCSC